MGLSAQQSQQLYGTPAYTGWGETEAAADWRAKGSPAPSGGGGGGGSADAILNEAVNSYASLFKQVKPYDEVNPFSFDEQLARQASTAEYSPYYDEMLSDYTSTVQRSSSRSEEDLKSTLEQLSAGKEYYMGTERKVLDRALDSTNNGFAGRGLFFSGAREKDIGQLKEDYQARTGEYERQYGYNTGQANLSNKRTQEDLSTSLQNYQRDIGREKQYAIESGVLNRKSEAVQQYEMGRQKYYDSQMYGAGV